MSSRAFVFLLLLHLLRILGVHSDVLFEEGRFKFARNGKRQIFYDVEHIDDGLIGDNHDFVKVKTRMEVLLPDSVINLKQLRQLVLISCHIVRIESGAFVNLPNLTVLQLQDNEIRQIKRDVFNKLPVRILCLQRNEIKTIDEEAFDHMPNLYKIKLNHNRLKVWKAEWFTNSPQITELFFRRNKLKVLPPGAFSNIKRSDAKIYLSSNKLGTLNATSFYGLKKVGQLYLDRNNITQLPDGLFRDLEEVDVMYLTRNKISEVSSSVFPKLAKIAILDLSSNLLNCLPYELVSIANITNFMSNEGSCECLLEHETKLRSENKSNEITYDSDLCLGVTNKK